jgi:two-component system, cell cycle response regulator
VVVVCNHGRDDLQELVELLQKRGMDVRPSHSLAETRRLLREVRPEVVVLNPLTLVTGGIELELVESLQRDDDPIPVVLVVDDLTMLGDAHRWQLPIRDFVRKPMSSSETLHRVELALAHRRRHSMLVMRQRHLEGQISVDFKTGLLSEQYFSRILILEWKRARRHQDALSLLFLDVDDFKAVNDSTEYTFGDEVLRKVGETLRNTVRETDFPARIGGDEFCVLLPQTTPREAVQTAMRIRQRIADTVIVRGQYSRQVTVSIGIDAHDARSAGSPELLRSRANHALKEAKRRGKNQVWLYAGQSTNGDGSATAEASNSNDRRRADSERSQGG